MHLCKLLLKKNKLFKNKGVFSKEKMMLLFKWHQIRKKTTLGLMQKKDPIELEEK